MTARGPDQVVPAVRPLNPKVVALGGGHGLFASLSALRRVTRQLTAIVTVADDGGSSGVLRRDFGVLPPGDLRMALAALWELLGDTVQGLDWVGRLLGAHGRVLPMASVPLDLVAEVEGADPDRPGEITLIRGQVACASTTGRVRSVSLIPADPPACPQGIAAVATADWVVLGPGSWFTSVLPHLLVPELAEALITTPARRIVALNLVPQAGETDGFSPHAHLEAIADHAPGLTVDVVLADRSAAGGSAAELEKAASLLGGRLVLTNLAMRDGSPLHDPRRLAGAFAEIFEGE